MNMVKNCVDVQMYKQIIKTQICTLTGRKTIFFYYTTTYLERKGSVAVSGPLLLTDADFTWPLLGLKVSPVLLPNPLTTRLAQIKTLVLG